MHMSGAPDHSSRTWNLSLSDPRCVLAEDNCKAFLQAHDASQRRISWESQFEYGWWTCWYFAAVMAPFILLRVYRDWKHSQGGHAYVATVKKSDKALAAGRFVSYRAFRGKVADRFGLPNLGMLLFLLAGVLFLALLTFIQRPWYRRFRGYGSPPLAVRTGLMAAACTPYIIALGGKANFVTLVTGIGHEKLNVIHRWLGWACFALSVVHTVPFIVAPLRDNGISALTEAFYAPGSFEFSGTPPLAILFGIVVLSIPWIRTRFYESFYWVHILLGVTYVGLCFWHFLYTIDSWNYLWATLALWFASWLVRLFWKMRATNLRDAWFEGSESRLTALPGNMTRIDVTVPPNFTWRPGQHCFLRWPGISLPQSHPFTIATAMPTVLVEDTQTVHVKADELQDVEKTTSLHYALPESMSFFARSYSGFTKTLYQSINGFESGSNVWVDGPYGGADRKVEYLFDTLVLVVGGSGITAALPWVQHLVALRDMCPEEISVRRVKLVWIMRSWKHFEWTADELSTASKASPAGFLDCDFHVSGMSSEKDIVAAPESDDDEIEVVGTSAQANQTNIIEDMKRTGSLHFGRPSVSSVVENLELGPRSFIFGCGPRSLNIDLTNATARAQKRVFSGEVAEIALHTEIFGW